MATSKALSHRTKIEFKVQLTGVDKKDFYIAAVKDDKESIVVVKLHKRSEFHSNGLIANHKRLVDMRSVADATAEILQMLYDTEKLTKETYESLMVSIRPCRDKYRMFESLHDFMLIGDGNIWL